MTRIVATLVTSIFVPQAVANAPPEPERPGFATPSSAESSPSLPDRPVFHDSASGCVHTGIPYVMQAREDDAPRSPTKPPYRIVCRFHLVRSSLGESTFDESRIDAWMQDLNYGFRGTPFVFVREPGMVYIDNDEYFTDLADLAEIYEMMRAYEAPGVYNFFFAPLLFSGDFESTTSGANPRGLALQQTTIGVPRLMVTSTHDTGHMFGLYHPYETRFGVECADGRNAAIRGDRLVGTPASPGVYSANTTATGVYFANDLGPCIDDAPYAPHTKNYMEARWQPGNILRSEWLPDQIDKMVETLMTLQADMIGPDRPGFIVDCDSDGIDDIEAILGGLVADVNQDMTPDSCQTFPEPGDLLVTGYTGDTDNQPRYYNTQTGDYRGTIWNGYTWTHQARYGPDGLIYVPRLTLVTRLDPKTGRTHDNFIGSMLEGASALVDVLFTSDGRLLTLDNPTAKIRAYDDQTGEFLGEFADLGSVGMSSPKYMEFGPDGNIYVVGNGALGDTIQRVGGLSGELLGSFIDPRAGGLRAGQGLVFHGDFLYVSSATNASVLKFDALTGEFEDVFVAPGSGGLQNPHSLRFGPDGNLYVASRNTNSVKRYSGSTGEYIDDAVEAGPDGPLLPAGLVFIRAETCIADLAAPPGVLDFTDVLAFLTAFGAMDTPADLAEPIGVYDFSDVVGFLTAFGAGCP